MAGDPILVLQMQRMGDLLLSFPMFLWLSRSYPGRELHVVAEGTFFHPLMPVSPPATYITWPAAEAGALSSRRYRLIVNLSIREEAARLAALNGTEEEIEALKAILAETRHLILAGKSMACADRDFHARIAAMSRNPILEAALKLIWHNGQYSPLLEAIRHKRGRTLGGDHERILQAIASGDGERARLAMADHMDNVLRDVEELQE